MDTYAQHLTIDCESSREGFMNIYFLPLKMKICKEKNEKKRPFFSAKKKIFGALRAPKIFLGFDSADPAVIMSSFG